MSKKSDIIDGTEDLFHKKSPKEEVKVKPKVKELKGYGGWLILVSLFLTIWSVGVFKSILDYTDIWYDILEIIVIVLFTVLLDVCFVRNKKLFIILFKIFSVYFVLMGIGFIFWVSLVEGIPFIICGIIWFLYAQYSKRVKNTYVEKGWL